MVGSQTTSRHVREQEAQRIFDMAFRDRQGEYINSGITIHVLIDRY